MSPLACWHSRQFPHLTVTRLTPGETRVTSGRFCVQTRLSVALGSPHGQTWLLLSQILCPRSRQKQENLLQPIHSSIHSLILREHACGSQKSTSVVCVFLSCPPSYTLCVAVCAHLYGCMLTCVHMSVEARVSTGPSLHHLPLQNLLLSLELTAHLDCWPEALCILPAL